MKKLISLFVIAAVLFTGAAFSSAESISSLVEEMPKYQAEDALTTRPDDSIYAVLKLSDTAGFLNWLFSEANVNVFMPLILESENSEDIIGGIEMISAIAKNTPVRSIVLIAGITAANVKAQDPFLQMAFTVAPELGSTVRLVAQGKAGAKDVAKLLLGTDSPFVSFAESMIKVEAADDNILKINNAVFLKAEGDILLLGLAADDVKASVKALADPKERLFASAHRKFKTEDFAFLHVDHKVVEALDNEGELKSADLSSYLEKPINVEFGFEKQTDKFTFSGATNFIEAFKKPYADKLMGANKNVKPVKGGYIDLKNSGGATVPMLAFGGKFDFSSTNDVEGVKEALNETWKVLKKYFNISPEEVYALLDGPLSLVVNGSVMFETFKIPAVYVAQTGTKGAAEKIYAKLTKSKYFHKVHDGILQADSSISPVSCIVGNAGDTLGIAFAELASFQDRPALEGMFGDLMGRESIASFWIDFAGIQAWLNDDSNGVFKTLSPMAGLFGYAKELQAVRDVLSAELSVPSIAFRSDDVETFHVEFALKEIKPENGLFSKLIKVYRDFK